MNRRVRGADRLVEQLGGAPGRGRVARAVGSVDADDGVQVDQSASLELSDPHERHPGMLGQAADPDAGRGGELPAGGEGEPVPQPSGVGLPEHSAGVVVAVTAERLTEVRVSSPDGCGTQASGRRGRSRRRCAGAGTATPVRRADASGVDRAEARRGQRHEQARVPATVSGTPLPPASPARTSWKVSRR